MCDVYLQNWNAFLEPGIVDWPRFHILNSPISSTIKTHIHYSITKAIFFINFTKFHCFFFSYNKSSLVQLYIFSFSLKKGEVPKKS